MPQKRKPSKLEKQATPAALRFEKTPSQSAYREQALVLFPHVCARCGREFSGKNLRELTVHHKDNNHKNNPSDGSNWELLCLYCHDDAHEAYERTGARGAAAVYRDAAPPSGMQAFGALKSLLNLPDDRPDSDPSIES